MLIGFSLFIGPLPASSGYAQRCAGVHFENDLANRRVTDKWQSKSVADLSSAGSFVPWSRKLERRRDLQAAESFVSAG